jgi:hypothetical protein
MQRLHFRDGVPGFVMCRVDVVTFRPARGSAFQSHRLTSCARRDRRVGSEAFEATDRHGLKASASGVRCDDSVKVVDIVKVMVNQMGGEVHCASIPASALRRHRWAVRRLGSRGLAW